MNKELNLDNPKTPAEATAATVAAQKNLDKLNDAPIPKERRRLLMVDPGQFMMFFKKGLRLDKRLKVIEGVPDDAKLLAVFHDVSRNGIMMLVTSEEYDEIPINILPPTQLVSISVGVDKATKPKKTSHKK